MSNTAEVIIIGGGVHGASLTFHLAANGNLGHQQWLLASPTMFGHSKNC